MHNEFLISVEVIMPIVVAGNHECEWAAVIDEFGCWQFRGWNVTGAQENSIAVLFQIIRTGPPGIGAGNYARPAT